MPGLPRFLKPVTTVEPRPADPALARYVRSYLLMRIFVGALGIALPPLVVLVDAVWLGGEPFLRTSLSAYYYSGAREVFVGGLCAIGVFLVTYKVAEINLDNTLSVVAGAFAAGVALCPTDPPAGDVPLTPLQQKLGEHCVATFHIVSAAVFIGALAVLSYFFGKREGRRDRRPGQKLAPAFWKWFHWACAVVIVAALLWMLGHKVVGWGPSRTLLIGETASVWVFGASWLCKGFERDMLHAPPRVHV